ncbi:MAG: 50S ribosomal protein L24 [Burkholderia sp.]|nr:50S ribosomal protein L24 [Burkholderia sp.]
MNRIRKGDEVVVTTGKDRGKRGTVLKVHGGRATIDGINLVKKHMKPNPIKNKIGGLESKMMSVHISNITFFDKNGKASRIGIKIDDGKKIRFLKSTGAILST